MNDLPLGVLASALLVFGLMAWEIYTLKRRLAWALKEVDGWIECSKQWKNACIGYDAQWVEYLRVRRELGEAQAEIERLKKGKQIL